MNNFTVRKAGPEDAQLILNFIAELAKYEEAEHQVLATRESILESLFSKNATAKALICSLHNKPIGYAVYFYNYSTWLGKNGLYLEDLYISPNHRNCGAGKFLLNHLAQLAVANDCGRFEWCVLDWNEPAIKFYEKIGAKAQKEWVIYRLTGEDLRSFAKAK
ncbi:GNAT family N-acetyltransferase [Geopsychrobacter electrodiphilus]|uniref:GNAT family N-acetyltransferase n=1 Tax=Geopsychrobacter electrodiphilus TaxID=225196 RepID=UPI0003783324|nr:GNAT family N-acetyltransferase [Geopsychrobacter electrodiphilus]